jgi:carboxylesterase type B
LPPLTDGEASGRDAGKLAAAMHTLWANFIRNGDPNVGEALPGEAPWPKYDTRKTEVLFLGEKITAEPLAEHAGSAASPLRLLLFPHSVSFQPILDGFVLT